MTDPNSNRNRQSAGQPTGGQFATETKGTDTGVSLSDGIDDNDSVFTMESRRRAADGLDAAEARHRYETQQMFVQFVRNLVPHAHRITIANPDFNETSKRFVKIEDTDGNEMPFQSDTPGSPGELLRRFNSETLGLRFGENVLEHDPDGSKAPPQVILPNSTGEVTDQTYPMAMVTHDGVPSVRVFATEQQRDEAIIEMARDRWDQNAGVVDFGGVYPDDIETARDFIEWDEPDATLYEGE